MLPLPDTAEQALRKYFSALTTGDIAEIRACVDDDLYVRVQPRSEHNGTLAFQEALERHILLTEDTEGFEIHHETLEVREDGGTAWFEGHQVWSVEWDGKLNRLKVHVTGVLEQDRGTWKLVQLHASPR